MTKNGYYIIIGLVIMNGKDARYTAFELAQKKAQNDEKIEKMIRRYEETHPSKSLSRYHEDHPEIAAFNAKISEHPQAS